MKVIDLFCGVGGASTGFERAGHDVVLAVDKDPVSLFIHQKNHPTTRHVLADLGFKDAEKFGNELKKFIGGAEYHLHCSPPCQSFSKAGKSRGKKRRVDSSYLMAWTVKLIQYLQPTTWSVENVPPVLQHMWINHFDFFEAPGVNWSLVEGWHFGAPVLRKRLFFGRGFKLIPNIIDPTKCPLIKALPYLDPDTDFVKNEVTNKLVRDPRVGSNIDKTYFPSTKWLPEQGEQLRSVNLPCYAPRAVARNQLWKRGDAIAGTERYEYESWRILTVRECAVMQGFHERWKLPKLRRDYEATFFTEVNGEETTTLALRPMMSDYTRGVGNSVCPPIAEEIGRQIA
jgi:site-specific DNA-cytosine methylase